MREWGCAEAYRMKKQMKCEIIIWMNWMSRVRCNDSFAGIDYAFFYFCICRCCRRLSYVCAFNAKTRCSFSFVRETNREVNYTCAFYNRNYMRLCAPSNDGTNSRKRARETSRNQQRRRRSSSNSSVRTRHQRRRRRRHRQNIINWLLCLCVHVDGSTTILYVFFS